jgi:AICAR transformylase/IMP cyclohydrolase PurH
MDETKYSAKYNFSHTKHYESVIGDNGSITANNVSGSTLNEELIKKFEKLLQENPLNNSQIEEVKNASKSFRGTLEKLPAKVFSYIRDLSVEVAAELINKTFMN